MAGIIYKFNGYLTPKLAFCPFPALPDFYEITLPGVGLLTPDAFPCSAPAIHPAIRGMDYSDNQVIYVTDEGSPADPAIFTDVELQAVHHAAFQTFGQASAAGNSTAINTGNCDMGVYVFLSGDGGTGNEQGYGLILNSGGLVQLVQFTNGLAEPYEVLAFRAGVFALDQYTNIRLDGVFDAANLKGVYLRALVNGQIMEEFVYCGGNAYIPTIPSFSGWGIVAYNSTVVFTGNFPEL